MNQIIVILIILKKWFASIKPSLLNLFFIILALLSVAYCYMIYNHIQDQYLEIECCTQNKSERDSTQITISLDYASLDKKYDYYKKERKLLPISSNVKISSFIDNIDTTAKIIKSDNLRDWYGKHLSVWYGDHQVAFDQNCSNFYFADGLVSTYLNFTYEDNSWLFIRSKGSKLTSQKESVALEDIQENSANAVIIRETDYIESLDDYDIYIGRKKKLISYNSLNVYTIDRSTYKGIDTIVSQYEIEKGGYRPHFYSAYDISKLDLHFAVALSNSKTSLEVDFLDLFELSNANPVPDIVTTHSFIYTDSLKLRYIQHNGIDCFVNFPKAQNLQQIRNYVLSALLTLFFTLFCTTLWKIIKSTYSQRKRYNSVRDELLASKHKQLYFKLCKQRWLSNSIIGFIISLIFYGIYPSKSINSLIGIVTVFTLFIPYVYYLRSYAFAQKHMMVSKEEYITFLKKLHIALFIFSVIAIILATFKLVPKNDMSTGLIFFMVFLIFASILVLLSYYLSKLLTNSLYKHLKKGTIRKYYIYNLVFSILLFIIDAVYFLITFRISFGVIFLGVVFLGFAIYNGIKLCKN